MQAGRGVGCGSSRGGAGNWANDVDTVTRGGGAHHAAAAREVLLLLDRPRLGCICCIARRPTVLGA